MTQLDKWMMDPGYSWYLTVVRFWASTLCEGMAIAATATSLARRDANEECMVVS
jgi:hypothetical protein